MEKNKNRKLDRKIAELTQKLNLFDLEEVLDAAIDQIPAIIQAQRISIYLIDEKERQFVARRRTSNKLQEHFLEKISLESKHSILPHVLDKNEPILIRNVQEYIEKHKLAINISKRQRYTSGSCMLVPIKAKLPNGMDKALGVVNFAEKSDFTSFSKYDLDLANHLVTLMATSVHNCLVVEKKLGGRQKELLNELDNIKEAFAQKELKLDEAKKKQTQMLPELPKIEGYDLDVHYSPMETIGGDFYDFIQISDREIGIVLGDVSGHGIEAALVMSMAKQILSIYSKLHRSLTDMLAHANDEIFSNLKGDSFIAVFFGILNTSTHVMRYVRAGQTYPILYNPKRDPKISELKSTGVVLGTIRGHGERFRSMIEEKYIQFKAGDTLLLYTDGAVEATKADGEDYSVERLMGKVKSLSSKTVRDIVDIIQQDICEFTQSPQDDDISLLCLKANDICSPISFNTQTLEKSLLQEADSFIVAPELSYDENVQYQMLNLEEKISELELQLEGIDQDKRELEDKCDELSTALDMASNDPQGYIKALRSQLQIALELPKNLIAENGQLHKNIAQQKQELRSMEAELNQLISHMKILKDNNENLQAKAKERERFCRDCANGIKREVTSSLVQFDKKILDSLNRQDYEGTLKLLVNYLNIAMEQVDTVALMNFHRQHFFLTNLFLRYLRQFIGNTR